MKAYHFLKDDMCGGYGTEKAWDIGEEREITDGEIILCGRGYHSSPSWYDALGYAGGNMACIVEVSPPIEKDQTKFVSRKRKLVDAQNAEKVLRAWACDCAERALRKAKVEDERSWNAIKVTRLFNDGKATQQELDAARAAAWAAEIKWQKRRLNWYMNRLFKASWIDMVTLTKPDNIHTCSVCGRTGIDVHEYPTYDKALGRDSTAWQCDDIETCLDRKYGDGNSNSL